MIRTFLNRDLRQVMEIWLEGNLLAHPFVSEEYWMSHYDMVVDALPKAEVYVYEDEESCHILGFIGLQDDYIAGLFVREAFCGKGVGKALVNHAKARKTALWLNVFCKNAVGVQFYLGQGFELREKTTNDATGEEEFSMVWKE